MIKYQRQEEILKVLETERAVKIRELTQALYVSEATIRRDLNALEKNGIVKRVFGGVVLTKYLNENLPLDLRERENHDLKEIVANKAAGFLRDGISIIMDGSSTVKMLLPHLNAFKNLMIVTNSLDVINSIHNPQIKILCTGGHFHSKNQVFFGHLAEDMLKGIHVDMLFFSSQGYSDSGEMTDSSEAESSIRRVMISRADTKVFLCDHTKLGKSYTFSVCSKSDVNHIVCDIELPQQRQAPQKHSTMWKGL